MPSSGLISNARQTGTLPHVFIDGQRVFRANLPSAAPSAAAPRAATTKLPALNRGDEEGLAAALLMTARQTPRDIHGVRSLGKICRQYGNDPLAHQYVKRNIWEHSTMVVKVDLRDREESIDGNALMSGPLRDADTALNCR